MPTQRVSGSVDVGGRALSGRRSRPRLSWLSSAALGVSTGSIVALLAMRSALTGVAPPLLLVGACGGYAVMVGALRRLRSLSLTLVVVAIGIETVTALAVPPRFTNDLWWYAVYGRMLGVRGVSPYTHVPAQFPHDPFLSMGGRAWAHTPSVYGPLFSAASAVAAKVLGSATLPTRLFYQGLAAAALVGACALVWRRTRSAGAVALLGANPVVALYLVNGGRNDMLVGLAMLGAVVCASQDRDVSAGLVAGLGALVKIVGVVGIAALIVSTATRRGSRAATRAALASAALVVPGYLTFHRAALTTPMDTAGTRYSRSSIWKVLRDVGLRLPSTHLVLGVLAVLVLVVMMKLRHRPNGAMAGSLAMLTLGASYTLPGYTGWALPSAAANEPSGIAGIVAAQGVLLTLVVGLSRRGWFAISVDGLPQLLRVLAPLAMVILVVALLRRVLRTSAR